MIKLAANLRVLVVDDMPSIHDDFRKILCPAPSVRGEMAALEMALFDDAPPAAGAAAPQYDVAFALQGKEGAAKVDEALTAGRPFALAFVDMRMPPGWDGIETIERLWRLDPQLQVVICTAYSDHSWTDVLRRLDVRDRLLVLKKPFDSIEVSQLASTLTAKWNLSQRAALQMSGLEDEVLQRTSELRRSNAALESQIVERKQLENQMVQQDKLASLGQLTTGIAHEINGPLDYVYANLGTLAEYFNTMRAMLAAYGREFSELADGPARQRLARLYDRLELDFLQDDVPVLMDHARLGIERVRAIVSDLADFSRVNTSEPWQWSDLHRGIDATLNLASRELRARADIVKEYGDLPEIECQPSHLNLAVMHLLVNAAQAMGRERGVIHIRTGRSGHGLVWLEVADNGGGIPPDVQRRVFEPFYTTKAKGTGLGLAIASGVVQRHGGNMEVHSTPGVGSTFRMLLPVRQPFRTG
jgi:two-component system, NtrC family, sensor kinase